jgi:tRNA nucleotidyltransferase/poly(A) polymerase
MAFYDDPSRVFRLIRFRHVMGFEIAPRTQSQLDNAVLGDYLHPNPAALTPDLRALLLTNPRLRRSRIWIVLDC